MKCKFKIFLSIFVISLLLCIKIGNYSSYVFRYGYESESFFTSEASFNSSQYNYKDLLNYVTKKRHTYLNIPIEKWDSIKAQHQDECVGFPEIYRLNFNNDYWQKMDTGNGTTFYAYGAYFDNRSTISGKRVIRILTMIDGYTPETDVFCHIWLKNVTAGIVTTVYEYISLFPWLHTGLIPYLISCQIPELYNNEPEMVSIMTKPCTPSQTNLLVHNYYEHSENRRNFAVCVKGMAFLNDNSLKLIEWLELLFAMGVDKVFFHKFEVHPNTEKVLFYYEQRGKIEVVPFSHPAYHSNIPRVREQLHIHNYPRQLINELLPYNDCFYRNMYKYNYISLLDIDEIIVPAKFDSWEKMMNDITANQNHTRYSSYCFSNHWFYDHLQNNGGSTDDHPFLYMLKNVIRVREPGPPRKCIHNTSEIINLHNHYALNCVTHSCTDYTAPIHVGSLHHHKLCKGTLCNFNQTYLVEDKTLWRYEKTLVPKVFEVASILGLK